MRVHVRNRAFTLIELLVAMALMVILTTIIAAFVLNAQKIYDSSVNQAQVMSSARGALLIMGRDLSNISPTTATSGLPIPDDQNFSPDGEPSTAPLVLRSPGYVPESEWRVGSNEMNWEGYAPITALGDPEPNEAAVRESAFLQFFATARYYDDTLEEPAFKQEPVVVQYYLRVRPEEDGFDMPGAFLMRRIQPYTIEMDSETGALTWEDWDTPIEDDICGFVRGVRVYYYDRDRDVIESGEDVRFIEAISAGALQPTSPLPEVNEPEMWDSQQEAVTFWIPGVWQEWLDPSLAQLPETPDFDKKMFLPPSIMVKLLVCNSNGNTYREVKEVFQLPSAPEQIPVNPFK